VSAPVPPSERRLVVASRSRAGLAADLGAELVTVPELVLDPQWSAAPAIEQWRTDLAAGPPVDQLVVAVRTEPAPRGPLVEFELDQWVAAVEVPVALWFAGLAAAAARCADGGQVVAVVDRPAPKRSAGWAPSSAVADAVETTVRSLGLRHADRGVGVNLVTVPVGGSGPSDDHVRTVAAVSLLLGARAAGLSGTVLAVGEGS
jgi:NAD(P)-dependent dehydrogenase (short-subunit alcohol dehydrogenase family)